MTSRERLSTNIAIIFLTLLCLSEPNSAELSEGSATTDGTMLLQAPMSTILPKNRLFYNSTSTKNTCQLTTKVWSVATINAAQSSAKAVGTFISPITAIIPYLMANSLQDTTKKELINMFKVRRLILYLRAPRTDLSLNLWSMRCIRWFITDCDADVRLDDSINFEDDWMGLIRWGYGICYLCWMICFKTSIN